MPAEFDRMVDAIKKTLRKQNPNMKEDTITSRAFAAATANWKKSHGGKAPYQEKLKDWRLLEFYVPIEEQIDRGDDEFIIRGVAINETTTLNNVKYVAEELEKAASSFRNVPILLDHRNEVRNIVGRTTENVIFNQSFRRIEFEGKIMDKGIREMIRDGRIGSVSIGAKVQDLTEEEDGSMKAVGIHGLEISLVAVPGDSQANLAQAIKQGFHLKEMIELDNQLNKKDKKMTEEEEKQEVEAPKEEAPAEEPKEEAPVEEPAEAPKEEPKEAAELAGMKAQIAEIKGLLIEKKKLKEQLDDEKEEPKEEPKEDETKGEVSTESEEALEKLDNLIVEKARDGFAIYRDYSKEDANNTNLKRLVR